MTTRYNSEIKKTLILAWPIMIGMVGQHLFGLVDTIMVGHHSTVELAASSFVNSIVNIFLVLLYGFSSGLSVLIAHARGRDNTSRVALLFKHGLICQLSLSFIFICILKILSFNLEIFGQTKEVVAHSHEYLSYMTYSLALIAPFMSLRQFSDGLEKTLPPTIMLSVGFLLNTVMNWFFIFGNWGFTEMGLAGAGLATLISRTVIFVILALFIFNKAFYKPYLSDFVSSRIEKAAFKSLIKIGGPSAIQYMFEVGLFVGAALLMGVLGTDTLAAHQVVINFASITFMFPMSLSIATSVRVGFAAGRKHWESAKHISLSSVYAAALTMTVFAIFFYFGRHDIPYWFTDDINVAKIASELFIFAALFQVFDGVQSVYIGALRGLGDVKLPTILTFIAYWAVGATFAYALAFHFGFIHRGIWLGLAISIIVASILLDLRFRYVINRHLRESQN
ncbi:MAG: MATE family efflux transporter [Bdellovibrionales bacterium]|nr:MATE family efflux transporter [Bdellovibrionales bacterium]